MHKYKDAWQKRYLIPCWIIQVVCAGIYGVLSGMAVSFFGAVSRGTKGPEDEIDEAIHKVSTMFAVITGIILGFCVLTIIFAIVEMILYAKKRLNPVLALIFAIIKTLYWLCWFVINILIIAKTKPAVGDIILSVLLFLTSLTQLILSARFVHLKRHGYFDNTMYQRASGGVEGVSLTGAPAEGVFYPDTRSAKQASAYEAYRSQSPAASTYAAYPGAPKGNYYDQDVEMRPQRPSH